MSTRRCTGMKTLPNGPMKRVSTYRGWSQGPVATFLFLQIIRYTYEVGSYIYSDSPLVDPSFPAFDFRSTLPVQTYLVGCPPRPSLPLNDVGTHIRHRSRSSIRPPLCQRSFHLGKAVISNFSGMHFRLQLGGQFKRRSSVFIVGGGVGFLCGKW